jgi:hypothetical protein
MHVAGIAEPISLLTLAVVRRGYRHEIQFRARGRARCDGD